MLVKMDSRPAMNFRAFLFILALLLGGTFAVSADTPSWGREIIHYKVSPRTGKEEKTGSTETQSDPAKNMLIQITRNGQGIEISRREFILDSKGRIRRGAIWDGQRKLLGRTEYGFDEYDRVNEERSFHASGRLIRRLLFKYDAASRRLVDRFFTWDPRNPYGPLVESKAGPNEASPILPIQQSDRELPGVGLPQFRGNEPAPVQASSPVAPAAKPPARSGFFDKLLKRGQKK